MAKRFLSFTQQAQQLVDRGLCVDDFQACQQFLSTTNYYRFSGYFRYWQKDPLNGDNDFLDGAEFITIKSIYDREQRFISECTRALRLVEILLRTQFAHHYASVVESNASLLRGEQLTKPSSSHVFTPEELIQRDLLRTKETFIKHYEDPADSNVVEKYRDLPTWVAVEAFSFGTLSRCIEASAGSGVLTEIAQSIGVAQAPLPTQVRSFVYLRNRCAHHSRLWNHSVLDAPAINANIARRAKRKYGSYANRSVFQILVALDSVIDKSDVEHDWLRLHIMPLLNEDTLFR